MNGDEYATSIMFSCGGDDGCLGQLLYVCTRVCSFPAGVMGSSYDWSQ